MESRQVMSPTHSLLRAKLRVSLVQGITSPRDAHQKVFAIVFFHSIPVIWLEWASNSVGKSHAILIRQKPRVDHNIYSTATTSQVLQLRCTILRQKFILHSSHCQIAKSCPHRFCFYNLLPMHHTLVHHSALDNFLCTSYFRTVMLQQFLRRIREQEQDGDSNQELQCHKHVHRHSLGNLLDFAIGLDPALPLNTSHGMRLGSIDRTHRSKLLPQSPRMTRKLTSEHLRIATTRWASACDAVLPIP